jgi:NAD(P)-dependent dehydrogenase (short-subunit alcohol dehydrogenase family)
MKNAIIAGSGRGIGREIAILLLEHHAINVVVCSRTQAQVSSVVQEIKDRLDHKYHSKQL